MQDPTLLLLAAGMGSRYGGLKQLDGIGPHGETIIDYSVYDAIKAGFGKVVFVIRESFAEEFKAKVGSKYASKIAVDYAYQPVEIEVEGVPKVVREKPWGTGHAVLVARDVIDAPFAVANADDFYGASSFQLMAEFLRRRVAPRRYCMVGFELEKTLSPNGTVSRGVCATDKSGCLKSVVERKNISADAKGIFDLEAGARIGLEAGMPVSMNLWGFHPDVFDVLAGHFTSFVQANINQPRAEFYIPLVVNALLQKEEAMVEVLPSAAQWQGVTYQEDKATVQAALKALHLAGAYEGML